MKPYVLHFHIKIVDNLWEKKIGQLSRKNVQFEVAKKKKQSLGIL